MSILCRRRFRQADKRYARITGIPQSDSFMPWDAIHPGRFDIIAIGASTGAPSLIEDLLCHLPADIPVPILIAQHLPPQFTESMAQRIAQNSAMTVVHAEEGMPLLPGAAYIAPGRQHMRVVKRLGEKPQIEISPGPEHRLYKPSADELFESLPPIYADRVLAIVMTGIGRDGCEGARAIHQAGGIILTQSKETCAIYGMPKAVDDAGLSYARLSPQEMRQAILKLIEPSDRFRDDD